MHDRSGELSFKRAAPTCYCLCLWGYVMAALEDGKSERKE
jgi:hypothetical protein